MAYVCVLNNNSMITCTDLSDVTDTAVQDNAEQLKLSLNRAVTHQSYQLHLLRSMHIIPYHIIKCMSNGFTDLPFIVVSFPSSVFLHYIE